MAFEIHCAFILVTAPVILGLKLQVDGKMDFGPKWNYEYRIKPLETETDNPIGLFTPMDNHQQAYVRESYTQPKFIDIIIKNNKVNPRLIQVAEARIYDRKGNDDRKLQDTQGETYDIQKMVRILDQNITDAYDGQRGNKRKDNENEGNKDEGLSIHISKEQPFEFSDEHTEPMIPNIKDVLTKTGKYVHHLIRFASNIETLKPKELEDIGESAQYEDRGNIRATILISANEKKTTERHTKKHKTERGANVKQNSTNKAKTTKVLTKTSFLSVTASHSTFTAQDMYIKPRLVRDDPKIKEFTKHIYEQSIKTLESLKKKFNHHEMKKETDQLMKSYEQKFGEFVRETQNQEIKTRLGSQKVMLNTLDTSNIILDRLVNHMIGKFDEKGILKNAGKMIVSELNKKKDLENKHICSKMGVCPTNDSFTRFLIDILTIILSSPDNKVIEIRDAATEVLKNTDFSNVLDPDTHKRFLNGIDDIEKYDVQIIRSIFVIMKNLLSSKNSPIEVVGPEDGRVNKTLAFLEIINNWEKKLPPNEKNVLEWNDMRNSFQEWKDGKRQDTVELMQHFTTHITHVISEEDGRLFDRHINTILGF